MSSNKMGNHVKYVRGLRQLEPKLLRYMSFAGDLP